ncbi:MAG: proteasome subunit alpha [Nitriliruptoraceae bacterium]
MAANFYVAPEQLMKDRAEYARKGIARGRALVAVEFAHGVIFAGENPSASLHKTSEIYDSIGFAAVGRYNEFEALRVAGIRLADVKGYQYAREDVTAKPLANAYSQALGASFMGETKPFEVELLIAQVDASRIDGTVADDASRTHEPAGEPAAEQADEQDDEASDVHDPHDASAGSSGGLELFHILYDGSIVDEHRFVAIGGDTEPLRNKLEERFLPGMDRDSAVRAAVGALSDVAGRTLTAGVLEVSGLDARRPRRRFFRLAVDELTAILDA